MNGNDSRERHHTFYVGNTPMDSTQNPLSLANTYFRKAAHARWHQHLSKQQILRSQLGFNDVPASRPAVCQGCVHYHGIAYGYTRASRTVLICGFHPYGYQENLCPDWQGSAI